jgi:glycosyltransferase involved in cell wall biosynthesis
MSPQPLHVAFLSQTDEKGASARLRVYALAPYLRERGIEVSLFPAPPATSALQYLRIIYQRLKERKKIGQIADVIVIQRDLVNHLRPWLEKAYARLQIPLVFDIDDAIDRRPPGHPPTWRSRLLGSNNKIEELAELADHMVLGNDFLAQRVRKWTDQVSVIPTALDLKSFPPPREPKIANPKEIVIGWIGSPLTTPYLTNIHSSLAALAKSCPILFRTVGASTLPWTDVPLDQRPWRRETEAADVDSFDIGVMPLSPDPWSQAKCGTKIIQYFAAGAAVVASPVGMNSFALDHGQAGLLAESEGDWLNAFESLIGDPALYMRLAQNGHKRAWEHYDVQVQAARWANLLMTLKPR